MKTLFSVFVVSVFLLITACQSAAVSEGNQDRTDSNPVVPSETAKPMQIIPQTSPPDSESGNEGVTMPDLTIPSDPNAQRLAQIAKEDLAQKFKVSIDQIQITAIEAMVWPDSSLGCPQMGSMYTQVLTQMENHTPIILMIKIAFCYVVRCRAGKFSSPHQVEHKH
jgi:hypothetical protein